MEEITDEELIKEMNKRFNDVVIGEKKTFMSNVRNIMFDMFDKDYVDLLEQVKEEVSKDYIKELMKDVDDKEHFIKMKYNGYGLDDEEELLDKIKCNTRFEMYEIFDYVSETEADVNKSEIFKKFDIDTLPCILEECKGSRELLYNKTIEKFRYFMACEWVLNKK